MSSGIDSVYRYKQTSYVDFGDMIRNVRILICRPATFGIFTLFILLGIFRFIGQPVDTERWNKRLRAREIPTITTAADNRLSRKKSETTEAATTSEPTACPGSMLLAFTDAMQQLSETRERFTFGLTPWKVDNETNATIADVRWSMIVMVKSHSKNIWQRMLARMTWGELKYLKGVRMETVFVVGKGANAEAETNLVLENNMYGDLLQLNREEKYSDVVFKTLAGMQYAGEHYPCDWIYTSADDDVMPNLTRIHQEIEKSIINVDKIKAEGNNTCQENSPLTIVCGYGCVQMARPHRSTNSKWYVAPKLYPLDQYPPYCQGAWYSMRTKNALELYNLSRKFPILWVDDAWITGSLRLKHILENADNRCLPTDLQTGLPLTSYWDRLIDVVDTNKLIEAWLQNSRSRNVDQTPIARDYTHIFQNIPK